jgi:hypothetical protein
LRDLLNTTCFLTPHQTLSVLLSLVCRADATQALIGDEPAHTVGAARIPKELAAWREIPLKRDIGNVVVLIERCEPGSGRTCAFLAAPAMNG